MRHDAVITDFLQTKHLIKRIDMTLTLENKRPPMPKNLVAQRSEARITVEPGKVPVLFDNPAQINEELISAKELARRLNVPLKTVRGWRYKRVLPAEAMITIGPRLVRYRWQAIKRWLQLTGGQYHG